MQATQDWRVPAGLEPSPDRYHYDLRQALASVVSISATAPEDALSAQALGTTRSGHGIVIREDGIVATIGYLITDADQVWLTTGDGRLIQGHALAYDTESGLGLVEALGRLRLPAMKLGQSRSLPLNCPVVVAGAGGPEHSIAATLASRQEFAGHWEYVLDEAIFTTPAHPFWAGAALIGPAGDLIGIGSLQLQKSEEDSSETPLNMFVPIELLKPILDDMIVLGRPNRPARPWLGIYVAEADGQTLVAGFTPGGPSAQAGLKRGDVILAVGGQALQGRADLFRRIWAAGDAGVVVKLTIQREGTTMTIAVPSADRQRLTKSRSLH